MQQVKEIDRSSEELPDDLRGEIESVLSVSIGNKPKSLLISPPFGEGKNDSRISEIMGGRVSQKQIENKIVALDISTKEGQEQYASIVDKGKDPEDDTQITSVHGPSILLDTSASGGFRVVLVISTCKIVKYETSEKNEKPLKRKVAK